MNNHKVHLKYKILGERLPNNKFVLILVKNFTEADVGIKLQEVFFNGKNFQKTFCVVDISKISSSRYILSELDKELDDEGDEDLIKFFI